MNPTVRAIRLWTNEDGEEFAAIVTASIEVEVVRSGMGGAVAAYSGGDFHGLRCKFAGYRGAAAAINEAQDAMNKCEHMDDESIYPALDKWAGAADKETP